MGSKIKKKFCLGVWGVDWEVGGWSKCIFFTIIQILNKKRIWGGGGVEVRGARLSDFFLQRIQI